MKFADAILQIRKNPRLVTALRSWSECQTFVALDEECCFQLFNDPEGRVVARGWQIGEGFCGIEGYPSEFVRGDWVLVHRNVDGTWDFFEPEARDDRTTTRHIVRGPNMEIIINSKPDSCKQCEGYGAVCEYREDGKIFRWTCPVCKGRGHLIQDDPKPDNTIEPPEYDKVVAP